MGSEISSSTTGSERKVENDWAVVFGNLEGLTEDVKQEAILQLRAMCSPKEFVSYNRDHQKMICSGVGIEGWNEVLVQRIEFKIPSPSNIEWKDMKHVLDGDVIVNINTEFFQEEDTSKQKEQYEELNEVFRNDTGAESCCRVFFLLYTILEGSTSHSLHVQRSIRSNHPASIDFLILVKNRTKSLLIAVKRLSVYTNLTAQSKECAQIFREAQIYFSSGSCGDEVELVLTNSDVWSFGTAVFQKSSGKVKITSTGTFLDFHKTYCLLKKILGR